MAIEASKQLAGEAKITGFQLRKVNIRRALIVPDTKEGIEVSLAMATVEDSSASSRTWRRFQITSYNASSDEWTEHCTGHITVDHEMASDPVDNGREAQEESRARESESFLANETCTKSMAFKSTYNNLQTSGLNFGPLFRNLADVRASGCGLGKVVGSVTVPDIAQSMPKQYLHSHLIHPATMDSMIHLMIAAVLDFTGKSTLDQIRLPTFIRDVWVSADLNSAPTHKFTGHATVFMVGSDKFEGQIHMLDEGTNTHRVRMDGIELTPLESGLAENSERKLCSAIEYKPDVHFLDSMSACALTSLNPTDDSEALYWVKRLQLATMLYVMDALDELKDIDVTKLDLHMQRFFDWMQHMKEMLERNEIIHLPYSELQEISQDETLKEAIGKEIEAHSAEGAITARMGRHIAQVVRQETDPLDLMFGQDAVMEQVYKEGLHLYNLPQHLQTHLSILRHQHSELKILEIGGGTGSFTAEVLAVLSPDLAKSKGNIASYTFTDISSGFFEKAKQRFQSWSDIMTFQSLNIERSPIEQGLQLGTYDLIFAGNVIHATANLQNALQNLRSLLKPGGQLIMQEGIRQDFLWYPLVFGQLPGWWLGDEPCRQWCPYIPAEEWNSLLLKAGFSGIDIEYPSSNDPDLTWQSILVSSAVETFKEQPSNTAVIVTLGTLKARQVIENLQAFLPELGYNSILVRAPAEVENSILPNALCISLLDLESPYLFDMSEVEYSKLKKMLSECQNLLWVTCNPLIQPHASMSLGLLRTVRWERDADGSNIVILTEAEPDTASAESIATAVGKIAKRQFVDKPENDRHAEYMLQNGVIHIGRLNEWEAADQFLAAQSSQQAPELQRLGDYDTPIVLQEAAVSTGEYHWVIDTQTEEAHEDTEVKIEIRAIGLSSDVSSNRLANEIAGVVTDVGPDVDGPAPGDRVIYISGGKRGGRIRTHDRANQLQLVRIPDEISFEVAASLAWAYATAIQGLGEIADLSPENTILIHTSGTDISQAAIQYAQMIGATIYATVATVEERDLLVSDYGISQDRIFSRRDSSFVKGIMRCTHNTGVDVVFSALSGEALRGSMACLAPFGTFVDMSNPDLRADTTVELASLRRNVSVHTIDLPLLAQRRPKSVRLLLTEALRLYSEGKISQLRTTTVMDFTQIKEGIRAAQSGEAAKVVIAPNPSNIVPVVPRPIWPCQFDPRASYVLAGGYGGLGRSLARWMASRGATSLIILSRSSASSPEKMELIADLDRMGCKVHSLVCDVADVSSLQQLSGETFSKLPAIKGCIQASMVLRVSPPVRVY
jgi:NADPH:quinone reductase-like Zn-dependent oxidoreductase/SAM-dependent methyltransferase